MKYSDQEKGMAALQQLISVLQQWLLAAKNHPSSAGSLAGLFDALADWLLASGVDAAAKLAIFVTRLNKWLAQLKNDPVSSELLPGVVRALRAWLSTLANGQNYLGPIDTAARWLEAGRPADQLPALITALQELLNAVSKTDPKLKSTVGNFSRGTAQWLRIDRMLVGQLRAPPRDRGGFAVSLAEIDGRFAASVVDDHEHWSHRHFSFCPLPF